MAYILSLQPQSPLKRSFSDNPCLSACSPLKDTRLGPLSDITTRNASACSLYSLRSNRVGYRSRENENASPLVSRSLLDLTPEETSCTFGSRSIIDEPCKRGGGVDRQPPAFSRVAAPSAPYSRRPKETQHVTKPYPSSDSSVEAMEISDSGVEQSELFNLYDAMHIPLPEENTADIEPHVEHEPALITVPAGSQPFRRWMSTLRRRHAQRRRDYVTEARRQSVDLTEGNITVLPPSVQLHESLHKMSESVSSSMGCVTAVKPASMTITSTSIAPRSDVGFHSKGVLGNRSSNYSETRRSLEVNRGAFGPIIDESAWLRSLQRRRVVEELIASEESYIADLKVLINVCS